MVILDREAVFEVVCRQIQFTNEDNCGTCYDGVIMI